MKKGIATALKILVGIIILLILIGGIIIWRINSNFLNFEPKSAYQEIEIKEIIIDGTAFRDLNGNGELDPYEDFRKPIGERAKNLSSLMTMDEKLLLLKGSGMRSGIGMGPAGQGVAGAVGTIVPIPRLGIPRLYLSDGPAGLRINPTRKKDNATYYCTAFPIGTMISSTWNADLVYQVGNAMGDEALEYGVDVILGPGANIHRNPLCGRNFEYYSEDPFLTGIIGAAMVNGIESKGVGTSVKHYVANNQEINRNYNDVIVSDRALREIYLKGFEIIVKKSQPWTIMSSYNKVNGTYTSESPFLLTEVLRDDWGFEGIVMTDWFGGKNPAAQISAGNDLLEPGTKKQWKALEKAEKNGDLTEEVINTAVERILKLILQSKKMENYTYSNSPDLKSHAQIAREAATEGMVLLKNDHNTLPLSSTQNVALFGVTSFDFIAGGTGSGDVNEAYTVSLEAGLQNAGYTINEATKKAFDLHKSQNVKAFKKPKNTFQAMIQHYAPPEMVPADETLNQSLIDADIAIITIGRNSGEGSDRVETDDFLLSEKEQELIHKVCEKFHEANKKVVLVMNIGGVIETASWKEKPDAILLAWQGGQEGGNAVADILSGKVNPSGKLPMTFPNSLHDHASSANFPLDGEPMSFKNFIWGKKEVSEDQKVKNKDFTLYEEGIYVGYRHFDKKELDVSYPFGFGLSYTTFQIENMNMDVSTDTINVKCIVTNSGSVAGKEVIALYASKPDTGIDRPIQELKSFAKTPLLQSGESAEINIHLPKSDLAFWNEVKNSWEVEKGSYLIKLGTSSRDIKLTETLEIQ